MNTKRKVCIFLKKSGSVSNFLVTLKIVELFKEYGIDCVFKGENELIFKDNNPDRNLMPEFGIVLNAIYDNKDLMTNISEIRYYPDADSEDFEDAIKEFKETDELYGS